LVVTRVNDLHPTKLELHVICKINTENAKYSLTEAQLSLSTYDHRLTCIYIS